MGGTALVVCGRRTHCVRRVLAAEGEIIKMFACRELTSSFLPNLKCRQHEQSSKPKLDTQKEKTLVKKSKTLNKTKIMKNLSNLT